MKPRLTIAFVHTFWDVFDHLGFWFACNLFWFLSLATVVLSPVATIGMLACHRRIIKGEEPRVREFFGDCRRYAAPAVYFFLLYLLVQGLAALNVYFYWTHFGTLGKFFAVATFFVMFFVKAVFVFIFPLILWRHSFATTLRLAFWLAVKHLLFVFLFMVASALIFFLLGMSVVAIPLFLWAVQVCFWGNIFDAVRRSEEKLPARPLPERTFRELFFPFQS